MCPLGHGSFTRSYGVFTIVRWARMHRAICCASACATRVAAARARSCSTELVGAEVGLTAFPAERLPLTTLERKAEELGVGGDGAGVCGAQGVRILSRADSLIAAGSRQV